MIIKAFEEMQKRRKGAGEDAAEDKSDEVVLLGEIRDLLRGASGLTSAQLERRVQALHDLGRRHVEHLLVVGRSACTVALQ